MRVSSRRPPAAAFWALCVAAFFAESALAQSFQQRKFLALVIGNANYTGTESKLRGPDFDAIDVADLLAGIGFSVHNSTTGITDLDTTRMTEAFDRFFSAIDEGTVALVYFSGHGFEDGGRNFLAPTDTVIYKPDDLDRLVSLNWVVRNIRDRGAATEIIILDACREKPVYLTTKGGSRGGLAQILNLGKGTKIVYSASAGQPSIPAPPNSRNSVFTAALLESSKNPGIGTFDDLLGLAAKTTMEMAAQHQRVQVPYAEGTLAINFRVLSPSRRLSAPADVGTKGSAGSNDECRIFDCTKK
jgi:uncharacterized caspase-like protein